VHRVDALVVGAGFAGLYALHRLRDDRLSVRVLEAGGGVGGTWYWNCYPGARCDVESVDYSYSFDEELEQEWVWSERYPAQPEILRYLNHVADRFDLWPDIQLDTSVTSAAWDDEAGRWTVTTDAGERWSAQFLVLCTGCLSARQIPDFPGLDSFTGEWHHTAAWPREGVDIAGKRVAPETVQGRPLAINAESGVMVNDANVVAADVEASNGVIHVIDKVLLP